MKEYKLSEKKFRIDGNRYTAYFVEGHSNLKAVISNSINNNAGDPWANRPDWQVEIYVLRKGSKEWENLYSGPKNDCPENLDPDKTLDNLLAELEDESVRRKILSEDDLREAQEDLRDARKRVRLRKKELKQLSLR
jgi:hypothetical protein